MLATIESFNRMPKFRPLTTIQTATELLERYDFIKKQERFQQVYRAIEQITHLLDEALVRE